MINPVTLHLSVAMLFDFLGWNEVAQRVIQSIAKPISLKIMTGDLARQMVGAMNTKCSEFASIRTGKI
jgi:isocitrate dehydrogenase